MSNVLSPRDLVSRPDNFDETVPHHHTTGRSWGSNPGPLATESDAIPQFLQIQSPRWESNGHGLQMMGA